MVWEQRLVQNSPNCAFPCSLEQLPHLTVKAFCWVYGTLVHGTITKFWKQICIHLCGHWSYSSNIDITETQIKTINFHTVTFTCLLMAFRELWKMFNCKTASRKYICVVLLFGALVKCSKKGGWNPNHLLCERVNMSQAPQYPSE